MGTNRDRQRLRISTTRVVVSEAVALDGVQEPTPRRRHDSADEAEARSQLAANGPARVEA